MDKAKTERLILLSAIAWYILTAFFSTGYFHADEHYQIIEFAGVKSGKVEKQDLAWEYREMVRPALQPMIASALFYLSDRVKLTDPYHKALLLRIVTALFALLAITYFARRCRKFIPEMLWLPFLFLSYFTWFLPFLNVRYSSETWSGLFLLVTAGLLLEDQKKTLHFLLLGLFAGLSFAFRFQTVTALAGMFLWLIMVRKENLKIASMSILIFLVVIGANVLLDRWFYEEVVFVPWRYFRANAIEGIASGFGTAPWYYYFYYIFRFAFFPVGIAILLAFVFLIVKRPMSLFTWTIVPFLIAHAVVPHKEIRFLFPLVNFVPVLLILFYTDILEWRRGFRYAKIIMGIVVALFIVNIAGLFTASLKPAGIGRMRITGMIHELASNRSVSLYCYTESNPYEPWNGLNAKFYADTTVHIQKMANISVLEGLKLVTIGENFLVLRVKDLQEPSVQNFVIRNQMKEQGRSVPEYLNPLLRIYGGFPMGEILVLYSDQQ